MLVFAFPLLPSLRPAGRGDVKPSSLKVSAAPGPGTFVGPPERELEEDAVGEIVR